MSRQDRNAIRRTSSRFFRDFVSQGGMQRPMKMAHRNTRCPFLAIFLIVVASGCSPRSLIQEDADPADAEELATSGQAPPGSNIQPSFEAAGPIATPLAGPEAALGDDRDPLSRNLGTQEVGENRAAMTLPLPEPPLTETNSPSSMDRNQGSEGLAEQAAWATNEMGSLASDPDDDQTAEDFLDRIRMANEDTQRLGRSLSGDRSVREQLAKVLEIKVAAARKLAKDPDATTGQSLVGQRSEIEALSGLASLGSQRAAEELKTAAADAIRSPIEPLANDGRVVLIAIAVQDMVRGDDLAVNEIVELARPFASASTEVISGGAAIPVLMTLGSAREKLNEYGHGEAADEVRQIISARFAQSPTIEIANLAAEMAGNVSHDEVDQLRAAIVDGEPMGMGQWREAVESLIDEAPDLQTVRYLGPLAFEMESLGKDDLADAIYDVLSRRFPDSQSATGIESELALRLARQRREIVGKLYETRLPSLDQSPLSLTDYRGRVVMMPFWASANPESLSIIPALEAIQKTDPKAIAIVGMKLDPTIPGDRELTSFPSFAASDADQESSGNPVAIQFGLSTLPFVAVIDKDGRVAGIGYRGEQIKQMVIDALGENE